MWTLKDKIMHWDISYESWSINEKLPKDFMSASQEVHNDVSLGDSFKLEDWVVAAVKIGRKRVWEDQQCYEQGDNCPYNITTGAQGRELISHL